jgi:2-polyprenyl-3-methyl-5-hydroxy-6-metoxy-1,4-benzoquinol methylase
MRAERVSARVLREVASRLTVDQRAEMAVPSYCHWNPLIRWLFWARLDAALTLAALRPDDVVVDFASGTGVLLPSIRAAGASFIGTDLLPQPTEGMLRLTGLPGRTMTLDDFATWAAAHPRSVDCIFALDVLEHVDDAELVMWSTAFAALLRAGGRLITAGGTETTPYKLGRAVAGFKNDYHHRSILDADAVVRRTWTRDRAIFLPPRPLPRAWFVARYWPVMQR